MLTVADQGSEDFRVNIIQVFDMNDHELESRINDALVSASASWISGRIQDSSANAPYISYQSKNYLSIRDGFQFDSGRFDEVFDYITINMITGERVTLNDLISINEEFIALMKQPYISSASDNTQQFDGNVDNLNRWLSEMSIAELKNRLEDCSKSQQEIINESLFTLEDSIGCLLFRNSFYLEKDSLVLVFGGWDRRITLGLDSIEAFLLVDKWQ